MSRSDSNSAAASSPQDQGKQAGETSANRLNIGAWLLQRPAWQGFLASIAVLALVTWLQYGQQLDHEFTNWDDNWLITDNRFIREASFDNVVAILNPSYSEGVNRDIREQLGNEYLPVRDFSYMLDYAISSWMPNEYGYSRGYRPGVFAFTNLLLHFLNVVLLYLLAVRLLRSRMAAFACALVFAVMPIHVEVVSWMSSRKDLLATAGVLGSVLLYLRFRSKEVGHVLGVDSVNVSESETRHTLAYTGAVICALLAMLSKTPAVVLPGLLLLIEVFARGSLKRASILRIAMYIAPFALVSVGIYALIAKPIASAGLLRGPYGGDWETSTYTVFSQLLNYPLSFVAGSPTGAVVDAPVVSGVSFAFVLSLLMFLLATAFTLVSARKAWKLGAISPTETRLDAVREDAKAWAQASYSDTRCPINAMRVGITRRASYRLVGLGVAWVLVACVPVSNILVPIGTVYADRYAYLPSIGFALAVGTFAGWLMSVACRHKPRLMLVPMLVLALWSGVQAVLTADAVEDWGNSQTLWTSVLERDPENHTALFNQARTNIELALQSPLPAEREARLAVALEALAKAQLHPARTFNYDPARVPLAMAQVYIQLDKPHEAIRRIREAESQLDQPWRTDRDRRTVLAALRNAEGQALAAMGDATGAQQKFREANSQGTDSSARLNEASLMVSEADRKWKAHGTLTPEIRREFERAISVLESMEGDAARGSAYHTHLARFRAKLAEAIHGVTDPNALAESQVPLPDEARSFYLKAREGYEVAVNDLRASAAVHKPELYLLLVEYADIVQRVPGSDEQALPLLEEASRLIPSRPEAWSILSDMLESLDRREAAIAALRKAYDLNGNVEIGFRLATMLMRNGQQRLGLRELNALHEKYPQHQPTRDELAASLLQIGDGQLKNLRDRSLAEFREQYKLRGKEPPEEISNALLISVMEPNKRFRDELTEISKLFNQAARLVVENSEPAKLCASFFTMLGQAKLLQAKSNDTRQINFIADAEEILRHAMKLDENNDDAAKWLAAIYLNLLEDAAKRANDFARIGLEEDAQKAFSEIWTYVANLAILSDTAREILAHKLLEQANVMNFRVEQELLDADRRLPADKLTEYKERMRGVVVLYELAATLKTEDFPDPLDRLVDYYRRTQEFDKGLEALQRMVTTLEGQPRGQSNLIMTTGSLMLRRAYEREREAERALKEALTSEDESARVKLTQSAMTLRGQASTYWQECARYWQTNLEKLPETLKREAHSNLGQAFQKLAKFEFRNQAKWRLEAYNTYLYDAQHFVNELKELALLLSYLLPEREQRLRRLREIQPLLAGDPLKEVEARIDELEQGGLLDQLRKDLDAGLAESVIKRLKEAGLTGNSAVLLEGDAWLKLGDTQKAAEAYERCITFPDTQLKAGNLYVSLNDDQYLGRASACFRQALVLFEGRRTELLAVQIAQEQDEPAAAEKTAGELEEVDLQLKSVNNAIDALATRSVEFVTQARAESVPELRINLLTRAVQIAPDNVPALRALAREQVLLGREKLKLAFEAADNPEFVRFVAGWKDEARNNFEGAVVSLRAAVATDPPYGLIDDLCRMAEIQIKDLFTLQTPAEGQRGLTSADNQLKRAKLLLDYERDERAKGRDTALDESEMAELDARISELSDTLRRLFGK